MTGVGGAGFPIEMPSLSRGAADRSEDLREPARIAGAWRDAQILRIGSGGQFAV